jgi:hypothetical protein
MLMPNPTALTMRPARTNGQRSFNLSEKWEKSNKTTAGRISPSASWAGDFKTETNSLATAYGGTVRRFEAVTEYPKPLMIEGKKKAIP